MMSTEGKEGMDGTEIRRDGNESVWKFILIASTISSVAECSRVIDSLDSFTDNIKVQDYCPKVSGCEYPGSHVLCVNNPNIIGWFGPRCYSTRNISVTESVAVRLLEVFNAMRSRIATGAEKGKDGEPLPKGYGIYRLEWDPESALFAQIWANQCMFSEDICHVTHRFKEPGQLVGKSRFYYPSWKKFEAKKKSLRQKSDDKALSERITHAIVGITKAWYAQKKYVERKILLSPSPNKNPGAGYLQLINGKMTHVGCGVSSYVEYIYNHAKLKDYVYNVISLVCNFSHRIKDMMPTYEIDEPNVAVGQSAKCGCPAGTEEEGNSCLCYVNSTRPDCPNNKRCKPKLIYLPIVNVDDAPQDYLPGDRFKKQHQGKYSAAVFTEDKKFLLLKKLKFYGSGGSRGQKGNGTAKDEAETTKRSHLVTLKEDVIVRNRAMKVSANRKPPLSISERQSIFTKVKPFELPSNGKSIYLSNLNPLSTRKIIKDVTPRKNFDEAKEYLDNYLKSRRHHLKSTDLNTHRHRFTKRYPYRRDLNTESPIKNLYVKNKFVFNDLNVTKSEPKTEHSLIKDDNNENDGKLLKLLDNLEQEVKHVQYKRNEIVHDKIKKIYDSITSPAFDIHSPANNVRKNVIEPDFPYISQNLVPTRRALQIPERNKPIEDSLHDHTHREINTNVYKPKARDVYKLNHVENDSNERSLQTSVIKKKYNEFSYDDTETKLNAYEKIVTKPEYLFNSLDLGPKKITRKNTVIYNIGRGVLHGHPATEISAVRKKFEEVKEHDRDEDEFKLITRPLLPQITIKDIRYDVKRTRYADLISKQDTPGISYRNENDYHIKARRQYLQGKLEMMKNKLRNIRTRPYNKFKETRPTKPVYESYETFKNRRNGLHTSKDIYLNSNDHLISEEDVSIKRNDKSRYEPTNEKKLELPLSAEVNSKLNKKARFEEMYEEGVQRQTPEDLYLQKQDRPISKDGNRKNQLQMDEGPGKTNEELRDDELRDEGFTEGKERLITKDVNMIDNDYPRKERPISNEHVRRNEQTKSEELDRKIIAEPSERFLNDPLYMSGRAHTLYGF